MNMLISEITLLQGYFPPVHRKKSFKSIVSQFSGYGIRKSLESPPQTLQKTLYQNVHPTPGKAPCAPFLFHFPLPAQLVTPAPSVIPAQPVTPAPSVIPAQPDTPAPSVTPAQLVTPAQPVTPAPSAIPAQLVTPAPSAIPAQLVTPAQPDNSAPSVIPAPSAIPAEPVIPAKAGISSIHRFATRDSYLCRNDRSFSFRIK